VVPRVAGHAYLPAPAGVAARLTAIAVVVAAVGVVLLEVGGRLALAAAWVVGLAALGAAVVRWRPSSRPGTRAAGRGRALRPSMHDQEGAMAAEHVAVLVVVGAVTATLVALPIAPTIGVWARYAVCTLFWGDCERPDALRASGEPGFACEQTSSTWGGNLNASFVVGLDRNLEYTLSTCSTAPPSCATATKQPPGPAPAGACSSTSTWAREASRWAVRPRPRPGCASSRRGLRLRGRRRRPLGAAVPVDPRCHRGAGGPAPRRP
jgi:hypothetical protein